MYDNKFAEEQGRMLAVERRNLILEKLQNERKVVVSELSALFDVSEETIRRDLDKLDREGLAIKSYGGAVLNENTGVDMPFNVRKKRNMKAKQEIAALVAGLVQEGEHIIVDPSTTAVSVVKALKARKKLTVITSSIEVLIELSDVTGWEIICTGGSLRENYLTLVGSRAADVIESFQADKVILSCKGIDLERGVTDANEALSQIKHAMLKSARQRILAADHTKFGNVAFSRICQLWDIDMVVTDIRPEQKWMDYLQRKESSACMTEKRVKTIAFANNKGGSGKTTTCANVGYSLSLLGRRVLLIDGDMQLNLTLSFFPEDEVMDYACGEKNLYAAMKKEEDLWDYVVHTPYENLDLVPSSTLMSGIEYELFAKWQRELILSRSLKRLKEEGGYDYILIDAPPTLGGWVMNILCASDYVILPVEASPWGLFGVANMFEFLDNVKRLVPELALLGVAITKLDARKNYGRQTLEALQAYEEVNVFRTLIRVDSEIEWAQDNSRPVMAHKKSARSAGEYLELAKEVEEHVGRSR